VLSTPEGTGLSAQELEQRSATAAGRYAAAGLVPGDRVLLSAGPSLDLVVAYVGALRYGLSVLPVNPAYTHAELAQVLADATPALALLDDPGRLNGLNAPGRLSRLSDPGRLSTPDLAGLPAPLPDVALDRAAAHDTALVMYTSGTTGAPKGVPLSHANLLAGAHAVRVAWRWQPDDRLLLCLPLFHLHGLGVGLHGTLTAGASAIIAPGFSPAGVASTISERGATLLFGVPTMYHQLAGSAYLPQLRALRLAVSGSAALPAALHKAVAQGSGQRILERYGMSETVMLVSNPYDGERRPGSVGFALPGVSVRLAPSGSGAAEIEVAGPNVFAGYLNRPQADAAAFTPDGWLRTGDLGEFDADGYLRISGRAKELIITGGYNVYPAEVEEVLRAYPGVADAAVVGAPSAQWGETVVAFVVPAHDGAVDAGVLAQWCASRLAPYKRPRAWRWIDEIPRNPLGKVLRHELTP